MSIAAGSTIMPVIKPYFPTAELEQRYKTAAEPTGNRRVR
jgi:hypothetical protein